MRLISVDGCPKLFPVRTTDEAGRAALLGGMDRFAILQEVHCARDWNTLDLALHAVAVLAARVGY